jgi:hypothetical protein
MHRYMFFTLGVPTSAPARAGKSIGFERGEAVADSLADKISEFQFD